MEDKYILGVKALANYFGMSNQDIMYLIEHHGIPGVKKLKRPASGRFPGGGVGVWALESKLADRYRFTRKNTPRYDPSKAVKALVDRFAGTNCTTVDELINNGYIDDLDWCAELNKFRFESHMKTPILMNPYDLQEWMGFEPPPLNDDDLFPNTTTIFKRIRVRRKDDTR